MAEGDPEPSPAIQFDHHRTFADFMSSTSKGCPLCKAVLGSSVFLEPYTDTGESSDNPCIDRSNLAKYQQDTESKIVCQFRSVAGNPCPTTVKWVIQSPTPELVGALDVWVQPDDPLASYFPSRPIPSDCLSEESLARLKSWLDKCMSEHRNCQFHESKLPTRVIDVGSPSTEPRLMLSYGKLGRWVALSHCWGGSIPIRTEQDSIERHKQSLPFSTLPPTFQDAILITRALGIPYIWIDSLCIIQDSPDDWLSESGLMHSVYRDAVLTIAAEAAASSNEGIRGSTSAGRSSTKAFPFSMTATANGGATRGKLHFNNLVPSTHAHDGGPLSTRAWTHQEYLLSRRMLRFAPHQTYWECSELKACEKDYTGLDIRSHWDIGLSQSFFGQPLTTENWKFVVNEYVWRAISYNSDRLIAISALARMFAESSEEGMGDYYAGIWSKNIHDNLLWETAIPGCTRLGGDIAPSWSWASVKLPPTEELKPYLDTSIMAVAVYDWIQTYDVSPKFKLANASINLESVNTFGMLEQGSFLQLSGRTFRTCSCKVPQAAMDYFDGFDENEDFEAQDEVPLADLECGAAPGSVDHKEFFLLCVAYQSWRDHWEPMTLQAACCLVLANNEDSDGQTRIGMVRVLIEGDFSVQGTLIPLAEEALANWEIQTLKIY
ncbi:hypothetical protein OQA88_654 [Cercophora sp. LCS_1]